MKRSSEEISGEAEEKASAKRVKSVEEPSELENIEVVLSKLSPKEREFFASIFDFKNLASFTSGTACQICDMDISYSVTTSAGPSSPSDRPQPAALKSNQSVIICCAECKQVDSALPYTICLECFRRGSEKEDDDHKNSHPYYVMDRLDYPIFTSDWSAIDDLLLLKGISQSGIDNWAETSEILGLKTGDECASHFYSFFFKEIE
jgi:hypothetical protein